MPVNKERSIIPDNIVPTEEIECFFDKFSDASEAPNNWGSRQDMEGTLDNLEVLVSTKDHKLVAVAEAMQHLGIERRITRIGIDHIDEPNGDVGTNTLIRGKARISVNRLLFLDHPQIATALKYFKGVEINALIQDVRPSVGHMDREDMQPVTNPTSDINRDNLRHYVRKGFHYGRRDPIKIRFQNAFDRVNLVCEPDGKEVQANYFYSPVIASAYIKYLANPLPTVAAVDDYLNLCKQLPRNGRLEKNLRAAGGVLNEVLILYALLNNIPIEANIVQDQAGTNGIRERIENLPLLPILEGVFSQPLLAELHKKIPLVEDGGMHEEWLRELAAVALLIKDFATGGSHDAVSALYGQVDYGGRSSCRDEGSYINIKPTVKIALT